MTIEQNIKYNLRFHKMMTKGINFIKAYNHGAFIGCFQVLEGTDNKSSSKCRSESQSAFWLTLGSGGENLDPGTDLKLVCKIEGGVTKKSDEYHYDPKTNLGLIVHIARTTLNPTWEEVLGEP